MAVSNKMMSFTTFRGTKFESLVFGIWQNKNPFQIYHLFNGFFHISKKIKNKKPSSSSQLLYIQQIY